MGVVCLIVVVDVLRGLTADGAGDTVPVCDGVRLFLASSALALRALISAASNLLGCFFRMIIGGPWSLSLPDKAGFCTKGDKKLQSL